MKNILFIYPSPNENKDARFSFSLNIAYASSLLKEKGWNTFFIDLSCQKYSMTEILKYILDHAIQVVAIEFDSFSLKRAENVKSGYEILQVIKEREEHVKTIAFGYECILLKKQILNADITITTDVIGGIVDAAENVISGQYLYLNVDYNFDELPYPDRKLIESIPAYRGQVKSTLIQTSVGCLNSCTFCQRRGWNVERKEHSLEYVIREFEFLQQNHYKNVWITDENFGFNSSRAKIILEELAKRRLTDGMKLFISCWSKVDIEFLDLAKKANVSIISMGIESANKESMKFYNKSVDVNHVQCLIQHAHKIGIYVVGNFIIGAPTERKKEVKRTFELIRKLSPDQVNIHTLDYMIGSEIYERLDRKRYDKTHYFGCLENGLGLIPKRQLSELKRDFMESYLRDNHNRLQDKIMRFGVPYWIEQK